MAIVRSAMKALAPAAHALNATGDVMEFSRAMQLVKDAGQIDEKMILAAERAVQAKADLAAAKKMWAASTKNILGVNNIGNVEFHQAVFRMAKAKIQLGMTNFELFLLELRAERVAAKLSELSEEELVVVKRAWKEAEEKINGRIKAETLKDLRALIKQLSKPGSELSEIELRLFENLITEFGGTIRFDLNPIKGKIIKPHIQVEGLGSSVQSRHIWLGDGVK